MTESADRGNRYAQYFLDQQDDLKPPPIMLAATRLLYHMSRIFQDNSLPQTGSSNLRIDRKRLKELQRKRIALGHRPDDHEDEPRWEQSM